MGFIKEQQEKASNGMYQDGLLLGQEIDKIVSDTIKATCDRLAEKIDLLSVENECNCDSYVVDMIDVNRECRRLKSDCNELIEE